MPDHSFEHLPLLQRFRDVANIRGGGQTSDKARDNKLNRARHSTNLSAQVQNATTAWKSQVSQRATDGIPATSSHIPIVLEIDTEVDEAILDFIRQHTSFEVVSELENGFLIVASPDQDLSELKRLIADFATTTIGSANVARLISLSGPENQADRLKRILSPSLMSQWGSLADDENYIVEIGVECQGTEEIASALVRNQRESEAQWASRQSEWADKRQQQYRAWDDIHYFREQEINEIIQFYSGRILNNITGDNDITNFPDHFTLQVELKGKGLRDLVLNYAYIFEVTEPENVLTPQKARLNYGSISTQITINPPSPHAPIVCVIDTGIQENHLLLATSIHSRASLSLIPGSLPSVDESKPYGHGTRVAGAVLYGEYLPNSGDVVQQEFWIQNAKICSGHDGAMPKNLFPGDVISKCIDYFHIATQTRIFNQSVGGTTPCRTTHMSAWACAIDNASHRNDVLFIVTAGNIAETTGSALNPGVKEMLERGEIYPDYLVEDSSRISNPGQSLQAITVGSIAVGSFDDGSWRSISKGRTYPSAFSRSGFGIWESIKPDVVEFGGDTLVNSSSGLVLVGTPSIASDCYPDLVASTLHGPTPPHARDGAVGTSFAAPKVSRIAARLQSLIPDESCLTYRALIAQSARWPDWAETLPADEKLSVLRTIGYGIPDEGRASTNDDHRVTLISDSDISIEAKTCHIFQVPIPPSMRRQGDEYDIRIDVTLSYVSQPKRTRRTSKRYLATWLEWKSSRLGEEMESFKRQCLKDSGSTAGLVRGDALKWNFRENPSWGVVKGVKRNASTLQKDWAVVKSNTLPEDFCIAVIAHQGWNRDPDAIARYSLVVTFDILNKEIPIYNDLLVEIESLRTTLDSQLEVEV